MAEFIAAMDTQNSNTVAEHLTRRVLAGDIEDVRARLVFALERLDYQVASEAPLQARRPARKGLVRADFLDHARRLQIGLRPSSNAAADAIVALAAAPPAASVCGQCGTENPGDARFCRLCGAPGAGSEPAELEVMRLTAGSRAALQEIAVGLAIALGILALTLPMILLATKPKVVNVGWAFLLIGELFGWWMTLSGVLRLHRTLNRKGPDAPARTLDSAAVSAPTLHAEQAAQLPPARARVSVTEGTTELLAPAPAREPVAARRRPDTNPFGEVDSRQ